jgi:hypothetical protein
MPSSTPTTDGGVLRRSSGRLHPPRRRRGRGLAVLVVLVVLGVLAAAGWVWVRGVIGSIPVREHCTATANGTATELDPEQTGNAATIAAIAVRRGLPARAASIGIATGIQESQLRNIAHGDRDSLGLFQQRPSQGWGTAQQVRDPVYAANSFFDALSRIEGYESMEITEVAQKVQRSAFPSAYADHEPQARILASALAGFSPAALNCVLRAPTAAGSADAVAQAARRETGRRGIVAGDTVTYQLRGEQATRLGWSLAHWALARAEALGVTAVSTGGRRWSREDSTDGWQPHDAAPAEGTVTIEGAAARTDGSP